MAVTVTKVAEPWLTTGLVYRIKYRAVNEVGAGEFSGTTSVALADLPSKPNLPVRMDSISTIDKVYLEWAAPTTTDSPGGDITGYKIEVDDGIGGELVPVYDN